ncbi:MAG TPA: nucleotide sugar dehydrogenase [Anaerolineae bacterium]|nr:nucleotide sugar dehydrogenase [Anaerolineae bacterium]
MDKPTMTNLTTLNQKISEKSAVIGVIGLGYVGLPVACVFAAAGFNVIGIDIVPQRVDMINNGRSPIEGDEPGLADLLAQVTASGHLRAATDYNDLAAADIISINVETPVAADNRPRYQALRAALTTLGPILKVGALVIVESTIAPGTTANIVTPLLTEHTLGQLNQDFFVGHCPERVMPGKLLYNLQNLSRVCGGSSPQVADTMIKLYSHIVSGDLDPADPLTAELSKTMENAYRDVQIAFANEMALLCEALGADIWKIRPLVNKSPSRNLHFPGAGVGGHCIPKDGWLLIANAPDTFTPRIIPQARAINDTMPQHVFDLTAGALAEAGLSINEANITILGYAYLENSDDTRNTPSAALLTHLQKTGANITIHDPFVHDYRDQSWTDAVRNADAVILMVAHDQYKAIDLAQLKPLLRTPIIIDGRHIFDRPQALELGFTGRWLGIAP